MAKCSVEVDNMQIIKLMYCLDKNEKLKYLLYSILQ